MDHQHVVRGTNFRAQISVIDWTTEDTPAHLKEDRPKFLVYVLKAEYDKATAFRAAGSQVYFDDDPDAAVDAMTAYVPTGLSQLPRSFRKYLLRWAKT